MAVPSEAGIAAVIRSVSKVRVQRTRKQDSIEVSDYLQAKVKPLSGVTGCCTSLMVTVPLEGLVHWMLRVVPAVTSRVL